MPYLSGFVEPCVDRLESEEQLAGRYTIFKSSLFREKGEIIMSGRNEGMHFEVGEGTSSRPRLPKKVPDFERMQRDNVGRASAEQREPLNKEWKEQQERHEKIFKTEAGIPEFLKCTSEYIMK
jgi:hypothetical protein